MPANPHEFLPRFHRAIEDFQRDRYGHEAEQQAALDARETNSSTVLVAPLLKPKDTIEPQTKQPLPGQ